MVFLAERYQQKSLKEGSGNPEDGQPDGDFDGEVSTKVAQ